MDIEISGTPPLLIVDGEPYVALRGDVSVEYTSKTIGTPNNYKHQKIKHSSEINGELIYVRDENRPVDTKQRKEIWYIDGEREIQFKNALITSAHKGDWRDTSIEIIAEEVEKYGT